MRPLPLGRSTFSSLRARNEIYMDKTDLIYRLAQFDAKIFLARPRRFGKSLLVSTFESLFKNGLKDFKDLAIEKLWNDKTYPVVRLDFSKVKHCSDVAKFEETFCDYLWEAFTAVGFRFDPNRTSFFVQLDSWFQNLPASSLVLLIDEYDAPLTEKLDNPSQFNAIRDILSRFFSLLKSNEGCLRFFFMTGITKFSNTSIFSTFNNLQDISLDPLYGSLVGFTEEEIKASFDEYLINASVILKTSVKDVLNKLKQNYNGFCFDEKAQCKVYCPWSVLNFFNRPDSGFQNYWYTSGGQPTVLMKYLVNHALSQPINYSEVKEVRLSALNAARQYDEIGVDVLLTEAGYYTIREVTEDQYAILGYPNQEVAISMAQLYADELLNGQRLRTPGSSPLSRVMSQSTAQEVVEQFNFAVNAIDYQRYPINDEASCRAYLQVLLIGAAMIPRVEVHNALGRSDMEVEIGNRHWVFEFKYAKSSTEINELLQHAVDQIQSRHYGNKADGRQLIRVALVFSGEERRFAAWKMI